MKSDSASLRYAVLWHSGIAEPHFDFMVETYAGSDLATWRSPAWPIERPTKLNRLKDHRRIYLDYDGDLTERRGRVDRIASGICRLTIGENSVWTIILLNHPTELHLQMIAGDLWEVAAL